MDNGSLVEDQFRRRYLYEHLLAIAESALPITRYYHWCFVDNLEWLEGFQARFGLIDLDTKTMKRSIKQSGEFYAELIREHGATEAMAQVALSENYLDYTGGEPVG